MQKYLDTPDGNLFIGESKKEIPFDIKRVYYINALGHAEAIRGKHAHKELRQVIFCINGSFSILLDDGHSKRKMELNDPAVGILMESMVWHEMSGFSKDCVILVIASDYYKPEDYIRDYDEFLLLNKKYGNKSV